MPVKEDLLEILCCPKSMSALKVVPEGAVGRINERISSGEVVYENGDPVKEPLAEALATVSNDRLYVVKDSIPIMLVDESIPAAQLGDEIASLLAAG